MGGLFCCLYQHSILHNRYLSPENDVFLIFTLYIYGSHLHSPISIKCMIVYIVVLIYLHSWHYSITHSQTSVHVTLAGLVAINTPHYTHVQTAQKVTNLTPIYISTSSHYHSRAIIIDTYPSDHFRTLYVIPI